MNLLVVLDSGPAGMITNPRASVANETCRLWLRTLLASGAQVALPEIVDYELRRELLRGDKVAGLERLDALKALVLYLPLNTPVMLKAAELWADARRQGTPTADDKALDIDVILAAQALLVTTDGNEAIIATTNVGHLSRFADAREWSRIEIE